MFHIIFYQPLYNLLVWLTDLSAGQFGLAIIILTLVVKTILFPLAHRASHAQRKNQSKISEIQVKTKEIQKKYKDNKEAQSKAIMELYRAHGFSPFSGFLLVLIQLPILLAIYWVVRAGLPFDSNELYSFISLPEAVDPVFLGINLLGKSFPLAIFVALTQFFQMKFAIPPPPPPSKDPKDTNSMQAHFAKSMQFNMRYFMPIVIGFAALSFPAALSIYWSVSNIFSIGHELVVKRQAEKLRIVETDLPK